MKFVCDSCHAQYMISDDKVGPNGVKVRCKKCSHVIVVKKVTEVVTDTVVMQNPLSGGPSTQPSADTPFGNLDLDEIGQAFDSVLSSGPHSKLPMTEQSSSGDMAASGTGGTSVEDRAATRVMDLAAMAGFATGESSGDKIPDAVKAGLGDPSGSANGHANGSGLTAPVPQTDWYVAINEEQIGPLDLDVVRGHWEEGRLTTDSLVWRNGYPDWRPLSTVADLVKVLTPVPTKRKAPEPPPEAPAGATASGPQTPWQATSPAPPPAAVPDPDAVDWKPAAASALASLVQEEMEALAKPPPKKEEPPPPEPKRGLLEVMEEAAPPVLAPAASPGSTLSTDAPAAPRLEPAYSPPVEEERPRPAPAPRRNSLPPRVEPDIPVYPAPSTYVPPPPESGNTKWIVIGVASLAVCATLITVVYMIMGRGTPPPVVATNETHEVPRPAAVETPPPAPQPAPVVAHPSPPPATPPAAPTPAPTPPPVVAQATPTPTPAPVAAQPSHAEEREERHSGKRGHHRGEKGGGGEEVVAANDAPPERHQAAAPEAPAPSASDSDVLSGAGKTKVDQDFDRLLGGSAKSEDAPPTKKARSNSTYIPPAMGSDLPDQLGKGDIMGVVAGHKDAIKICVAQQKAKDADASGSVVMHWQIQPSGSTTGVACKTDEFKSGPMAICMSNQIRSWKFPQFRGAPMPIDFPFRF